jgi:hypothetical protein
MRPRAILLASVVGVAVLPVATAASGSGGSGPQGREGPAGRTPAQISQKKLKKPCRRCKRLRIGQGSDGQPTCGPPEFVHEAVTAGSQVLELVASDPPGSENFAYITTAGDLLVAAIVTEGATITPPAGWQAVPGTDVSNGAGRRLQVFFSIPVPLSQHGEFGPDSHSFSASAVGDMRGVLFNVSGVDQAQPIAAAAGAGAGTPSTSVTAPSIAATSETTRLLYIGATGSPQTWSVPAGMKPLEFGPGGESGFGLAHELLRTAAQTGTRTATISSAAASVGALVALKLPPPTACPKIRILNRHSQAGVRFKVGDDGYVRARLKCRWSRRCVGALGLMLPTPVAAGAVSVPARKTRTVRLRVCRRTLRCPRSAPRLERKTPVGVQILLEAPNGQLVESTHRRDDHGVLRLP